MTTVEDPADSYDRGQAVRAILEKEDSVLGRVYMYDERGLSPAEIAEAEGNQEVAFVYNYRLQIKALISGEVPQSPWAARSVAAKLRKWLKSDAMDKRLRADLTTFGAALSSRADDPQAEAEEVDRAIAKSAEEENKNVPGIYVYTLPHYMKHRVDAASGKTLLKVGHSSVDAYFRAGTARRLTALPEDPILLRVYPVEQSAATEKEFHGWLRDADHEAGRTRRAGSEWFVTSTKFLDRIAKALALEVRVVNDFDAGEE